MSSKFLLPAQSVPFWLLFLLVPAELCVTSEQSVFRVGHTLLHMPQSHLHTRRSIPQGQLVATQCFLVSGIFWIASKERAYGMQL